MTRAHDVDVVLDDLGDGAVVVGDVAAHAHRSQLRDGTGRPRSIAAANSRASGGTASGPPENSCSVG